MTEPLIALHDVTKDYVSAAGVVHALRAIDIDIMPGEFVAIVGTSGSGKSTLMNILGCLDRPTHGTYTLAGFDVGARTNDGRAIVRNRLIGFIFQGFNLLPRTTALENVELPLSYRGVAASTRRARAEKALAAVGLQGRMDHTPNQLSGGQQQRVAIARALVTDPPLLLADEPTGNLDTRTSLEVLALLQRLNRDLGITICLVTHEHDIAACASRVITFRDGRIVSDVRQNEPKDAAGELQLLGPAEESKAEHSEEDPKVARLRRIGGPLPFAVYAMMFVGALLGLGVGAFYNSLVLGFKVAWIPPVAALLGEAIIGARYAKSRLGRPLTHDQRIRAALYYTLGTIVLWGAMTVLTMPDPMWKAILPLAGAKLAVFGLGILGVVLASALVRYGLLWAFSPRLRKLQPKPST